VDSKTVISAGDDGMVRVWDRDSAKETRNWKAHTAPITHMALSADGKTLVTGGLDKQLHVWDVPRATRLRSMPRRLGNGDALAMTANGKFVAIAGVNNTIERFDISTGKALAGSPVAKGAASALACSPGGNLLAAAFTNNQVQLIDFATGKQKHRLVCGSEDAEVLLAFAPDGQQLATVSAPDTTILWSTADGKEKQRLTLPQRDEVRCLAFGPGGNQLAVGYTNGGLRLWDARTGKVVKHIEFPHGVWAVAYAADGKTLAVGAEDAVTLFDTQTWQPARVYGKLHDIVPCLAFAPDGRHLAAGSFAGTIRLFDLTQPKDISDPEPRLLEGHQGVVNDIAWSANGRCLVSAGMDKTVRLWEFVNGQPIARWEGHQGQVSAVAFHPLGRKVVSASRDTTLLVWDVTLATPQEPRNLDADTLDQLWQTLASDNNPVANKALWTLTAGPRDSVAYLSKKVFVADPKKIEQCIRDLDSRNFKERQVAAATLASYGRWVEGVLRRALQDRPPEEVRQRIVVLLERLEGKNPVTFQQERLRVRRIIEALEQTITPAARALLQNLARGAAEEDLRDMAQAALKRMSSRLP